MIPRPAPYARNRICGPEVRTTHGFGCSRQNGKDSLAALGFGSQKRHRPCSPRGLSHRPAGGAQISEKCDGGHILTTIDAAKMSGVGSFQVAAFAPPAR
jgi:hypothetical protein